MNWAQTSYLVLADSVAGHPPLLHGMHLTAWQAHRDLETIMDEMPAHLTRNLRVTPAELTYSDAADAALLTPGGGHDET